MTNPGQMKWPDEPATGAELFQSTQPANGSPRTPERAVAPSWISDTGGFVTFLGWLALIGALVAGIWLALHTVTVCGTDDLIACGDTRHPFLGAGIGIAVGGAVNAIALIYLGSLGRYIGRDPSRPARPSAIFA